MPDRACKNLIFLNLLFSLSFICSPQFAVAVEEAPGTDPTSTESDEYNPDGIKSVEDYEKRVGKLIGGDNLKFEAFLKKLSEGDNLDLKKRAEAALKFIDEETKKEFGVKWSKLSAEQKNNIVNF